MFKPVSFNCTQSEQVRYTENKYDEIRWQKPYAPGCACSLRRLLESSSDAPEDVAAALQHTADGFVPGLPGLTKLVSLFTKQGKWRKALAIYDTLDCLGLQADLVICNAALGTCSSRLPPARIDPTSGGCCCNPGSRLRREVGMLRNSTVHPQLNKHMWLPRVGGGRLCDGWE